LKLGGAAPCQVDFRVLYLDGISFEVRHGEQVDPTII
jgi:hypothetical protein